MGLLLNTASRGAAGACTIRAARDATGGVWSRGLVCKVWGRCPVRPQCGRMATWAPLDLEKAAVNGAEASVLVGMQPAMGLWGLQMAGLQMTVW